MKVIRILGFVVSIIALIYYGYRLLGKPNGNKYEVDKNHHVYYKGDGVTETDAKNVGAYFSEIGLFGSDNEMDVQISGEKDAKEVSVKYVVDKSKITPQLEQSCLQISGAMGNRVFANKSIHVYLADEDLDNIKDLGTAVNQPIQ
jgi:hypothetical protein